MSYQCYTKMYREYSLHTVTMYNICYSGPFCHWAPNGLTVFLYLLSLSLFVLAFVLNQQLLVMFVVIKAIWSFAAKLETLPKHTPFWVHIASVKKHVVSNPHSFRLQNCHWKLTMKLSALFRCGCKFQGRFSQCIFELASLGLDIGLKPHDVVSGSPIGCHYPYKLWSIIRNNLDSCSSSFQRQHIFA